jgi:hypothetical protein
MMNDGPMRDESTSFVIRLRLAERASGEVLSY